MYAFPIQVKFPQGTEMLNIFKNFSCKTSILDDFDFYENRQKVMQDRRGKPLASSFDHPLVCTPQYKLHIYHYIYPLCLYGSIICSYAFCDNKANGFTCSIKMAMLYLMGYDWWKGIAIKIGWLVVTEDFSSICYSLQ